MELKAGERPNVDRNDKIALELSYYFLNKKWQAFINIPYYVFILMPLRHSKNNDALNLVLTHINCMKDSQNSYEELISRFRRATVKQLQVCFFLFVFVTANLLWFVLCFCV